MKKIVSMLLTVALTFTLVIGGTGSAFCATQSKIETVYEDTADYLYKTVTDPICGSIGGEWVLYGLSMADYPMSDAYIAKYTSAVEAAVKEGYRGQSGILHDRKYTEYSRIVVTYGQLGLDPTDVAGSNLLEFLADFDAVIWQGMNGPIWALQALDSGNFDIPKVKGQFSHFAGRTEEKITNVTTRQKLVDYILDGQLADGGWALSGTVSDPDMTGMAMAALAPYQNQKKVKTAINEAVAWLSKAQHANGTYSTWGVETSESCAQVIRGLIRCGVNPNTDSRFKKNGNSVVDGLMLFYDDEVCGFRHVNQASGGYEPIVNQMATEQGFYALAEFKTRVPNKVTVSTAAKSSSTALKVSWKKTSVGSGYQVVAATNSGFTKNVKKVTVSGRSAVSKKLTGLKKGKTYYVKVRAYKTVNGTKVYGAYSAVKKVKL